MENRYTLLRAKVTARAPTATDDMLRERKAAEATDLARDIDATRRRQAQVRAAQANVLSAKAALARAALELDAALHAAAPEPRRDFR